MADFASFSKDGNKYENAYDNKIDFLISMLEGLVPEDNWAKGSWHMPDSCGPASQQSCRALYVPPPATNIASKWNRKRAGAIPRLTCSFCKKNGETRQLYSSHVLKDGNGVVVCPVLRKYQCPICGQVGGDNAHTKRFCPLNPDQAAKRGKPLPEILKDRPNSMGKRCRFNSN